MKNLDFSIAVATMSMLSLSACGPMKQMTEMRDATVQMPDIMKKMQTTMDGMNTTMQGMDTTMKGMDNNMTSMRGDMKGMSGQMTGMSTSITDMHGDMKGMATDVKTMSGQMTGMNQSIVDMHGDMKGMATDVKVMSGQMTGMNQSIVDMHGDMKGMATDVKVMSGQMTNVNDSINVMSKQMTSVNDNMVIMTNQMTGLSGDIRKMGVTLDLTHADLRLIFTGEHRLAALDAMEASKEQVGKLGYAGEYMISHTYQAWNAKVDDHATRLSLMGLAVPDFFYKVSNYIADRDRVDPTRTDDQSMNLFAIAASLDYVNSIELDGLKGSDEPVVTMLSMIQEGLLAKADIESGKRKLADLPIYQREVLNREQDAIYLLRIRHNFLKGIAYTLSSSSASGDEPSKLASIWNVFKTRVLGKSITPKVDNMNVAQIEVIATVLDTAYATEKFLRDLGVDPKNNKNINALIRKMRTVPTDLKGSSEEIQHLNEALNRFVIQ